MAEAPETDLSDPVLAARRCSRSVQTTIGWIFWDPGAVARYEALGLPGPLGSIGARAAPLAPAGPDAVIVAFGSISPAAIRWTFDLARPGPVLWPTVDDLPTVGRPFFAAHLGRSRPDDPVFSGWHAINGLREWRGDTRWALVAAVGLTGVEASVLHNAWLDDDDGWIPRSRGSAEDDIAAALAGLRAEGLADDDGVNEAGIALRQRLEDDTDRLTTLPWERLGAAGCLRFAEELEPPCELLLARVDVTAGTNYQPASRIRPSR